jgi:hypothetical protein
VGRRGVELSGGSPRPSRGNESFAACGMALEASMGREGLCEGAVFAGVVCLGIRGSLFMREVVVLCRGEGEGDSSPRDV